MVAGGGHRYGGAAAERGEGRGKRNGRSTAHPGSTTTTGTATGAEEGGGAARVDEDGGVPAVGDRNGEVDEVGEDAAEPKEATPRREKVRGDDGDGPELGGDGGERERLSRPCFFTWIFRTLFLATADFRNDGNYTRGRRRRDDHGEATGGGKDGGGRHGRRRERRSDDARPRRSHGRGAVGCSECGGGGGAA
jgi:hypothetical protein